MFESPTMTCSRRKRSGIGVGLVACVDDRATPGRCRGHSFPYVLGALRQAVDRTAGGLQAPCPPRVDLAADEERNEHLGVMGEIVAPAGQVVLVAAVGIPRRVGVVLEEVDDPADPFLAQP